MWLSLLGNKYVWGALAIAAAIGAVYYAGGVGPRAELARFIDQERAAKAIHMAEDAKKAAQTQSLITQKDAEREQALVAVSTAWKSYSDGLLAANSGAGKGAKPAPIAAGICGSKNADQRLSDAVSKYRDSVRSTLAAERAGTGGLLEVCQSQTASWDNLKSAVAGIKDLNSQGARP